MTFRTRAVLGAAAAATAIGAAAAVIGCGQSGGVRIEGAAPVHAAEPFMSYAPAVPAVPGQATITPPSLRKQQDAPRSRSATAPGPIAARLTDRAVVDLLKSDPGVNVKKELRACEPDGDPYPVETAYADLTADGSQDLVVNVSTCTDGLAVGAYVYKAVDGRYENVFSAERPLVWAQITQDRLELAQQNYQESDPVYDPSSETVTTYRWNGRRFEPMLVTENSYAK